MSFSEKCEEYFQTKDFYEILNIERDATVAQVKKAFHKASLLVHPDRVPEDEKIDATEKFKVVSKIYSVLSDDEKRGIYDESGSFDDECCDTLSEWINVYNSLFKEVTIDAIDRHKAEYLNSEQEVRDIKKAYESTKGNMSRMHNAIPFLDVANEERILGIVRKLIDDGVVEEYDGFFNEPKAKKMRRKKREDSYTVSNEEAEKLRLDFTNRRNDESRSFALKMAEIEEKYCKPKGKKQAIKAKGQSGARTKLASGRVTRRTRN